MLPPGPEDDAQAGSPEEKARFARLKDIFLSLRDMRAELRDSYLQQACRDDPSLRNEVEALIHEESRSLDLLRADQFDSLLSAITESPTARPPETIGPYRLLEVLSEGGMGTVYRALQTEPIRREVALKVIRPGLASPSLMTRFEIERQALALMDHPNIVRVFEADTDATGAPYIVMELVRGVPVTKYAASKALSSRERLELFAVICRAVHDAHTKGVIHRDLKPSNILVSDHDGRPLPKIIDFGVAKATGPGASGHDLTHDGHLVGTLDYMSPEQALGVPGSIDTRSDVYSLGVILHELLTGSLPYDISNLPLRDALRAIETAGPLNLRRRARGARELDEDLERIIRKALDKDPNRRYGGAGALADDIERFLRSEPILARPPTTLYQVRKLVARHRVAVAFAGTIVGFVVLMAVILSFEVATQKRERARAEAESRKATQVSGFLQQMLASVNPGEKNRDVRVREVLDDAARQIDLGGLASEPEIEAAFRRTIGNTYLALGLYDEAREQLTRALALRRRAGGLRTGAGAHVEGEARTRDPLLAESLYDLAAFHLTGDVDRASVARADTLARAALAIRKSVLGEDAPDVAASLRQLGDVHNSRSRIGNLSSSRNDMAAAESLYTLAIRTMERSQQGEDPEIAKCLISLTGVEISQNRLAEADSCMRRAIVILKKTHPADHPDLAQGLATYSDFLANVRGEYALAESVAAEAVSMERRMWGDRHPRVANAIYSLAGHMIEQSRFAEAESLYREALEMQVAFHGDGTTPVAEALNNLGYMYWAKGDMEDAEASYRKAIDIWRSRGEEGSVLGIALNNLALAVGQRDQDEALNLQIEALHIFERVRDPGHRDLGLANNNIGAVLLRSGRFEEAEPYIRKAVEIWAVAYNAPHTSNAVALNNLGYVLHASGRLEEAEVEYRKALAIHEAISVHDSWSMMRFAAATNLGACLYEEGKLGEAEAILRNARERLRSTSSEPRANPSSESLLAVYGSLLADLGRTVEAEQVLHESLKLTTAKSPWAAWIRAALAACAARESRPLEADSLFQSCMPEAWSRSEMIPATRRIAHDRALGFYESIGRTDLIAWIQASDSADKDQAAARSGRGR